MRTFHLEANYDAEHNEVVIAGNEFALISVCREILQLLESEAPGAHIHLDEVHGLAGNVACVTIFKEDV